MLYNSYCYICYITVIHNCCITYLTVIYCHITVIQQFYDITMLYNSICHRTVI